MLQLILIPAVAHAHLVFQGLSNVANSSINNSTAFNFTNSSVNVTAIESNVSVGLVDQLLGGSFGTLSAVIINHGYSALFLLMALEQSSLPVPSEVVASLAGYLAYKQVLDFATAFFALTFGGMLGIAIDYYIGYYLGRDFLYRHIKFFHLKKEQLDKFDTWFQLNGSFAVFVTRLLPVVRTVMSFPAGFAHMNKLKFFGYSFLGLAIWNLSLMLFGYYLVGTEDVGIIAGSVAILLMVLYLSYRRVMKNIHSQTSYVTRLK